MTMNRVRCVWSNFSGAPGYTNFYTGTSVTDYTPIRTFFAAFSTYLPAAVSISVPTTGDQISEATGAITGSWAATVTGGAVTGSAGNTGVYSGASGIQVQWLTTLIARGRRIQGKTFIVPAYSGVYDSNGSLATAVQTAATAAGTALIAALASELKVWSRPATGYTGQQAIVTTARVPDLAVTLRSRRT